MPEAQSHFIISNYWHFFKGLKAASDEFLRRGLQRLTVGNKTALMPPKVNHRLRSFKGLRPWMVDFLGGAAVWRQLALPKVNHRLRSFKGLRSWMVDFLCEGGGVAACGMRPATCGMWQAAARAAKSQPPPTKFQGFAVLDG